MLGKKARAEAAQRSRQINERRAVLSQYLTELRQFIHQNGTAAGDVGEHAERILGQAAKIENPDEQDFLLLLKLACESAGRDSGETADGLFRFPEDRALHEAIIRLDANARQALLLIDMHGLEAEEAAKVLGCSPDEVLNSRQAGKTALDESAVPGHLERRLELLKRAYSRVSFPVPATSEQPGELPEQDFRQTQSRLKWPAAAVLLAALLLIISAFYLSSRNGPADEVFVKQLSERFDRDLAEYAGKFGLKQEELLGLYTIDNARNEFNSVKMLAEQAINRGEPLEKREVEKDYEEIIRYFELPSGMVRRLAKEPLTDDFKKSLEFFEQFHMKSWELSSILYDRLADYEEIAKENGAPGQDRPDVDLSGYPAPVQRAAELLKSEGFEFRKTAGTVEGQPSMVVRAPGISGAADHLHPAVSAFARLYEKRLDAELGGGTLPVVELAGDIGEMERWSDEWSGYSGMFQLEALANDQFKEIVHGGRSGPVFGKDGTVTPARREAWKMMAEFGEDSTAASIIRPVVKEMEASGWRKSAAYNRLGDNDYMEAFSDQPEWNYDSSMGFPPMTIDLPDEGFESRANRLYGELSRSGDIEMLADEPPVMTAVLYGMAFKNRDERMKALLSDGREPGTKEKAVRLIADGLSGGSTTVAFYPENISPGEAGIRAQISVFGNYGAESSELWLDYSASGTWLVDPASSD
ncbi:sigma factor-like helix-turn-helix DNA-binding protein [Bhargavaea ullalensis]|uniref:RNA polymerase sigma factor 70 region 4 type 2 domain-containing protein n=1 Tax=Bhargavaea ullalensis TaxID=1265685 RepID=A0ABV2GF75_9BACL